MLHRVKIAFMLKDCAEKKIKCLNVCCYFLSLDQKLAD